MILFEEQLLPLCELLDQIDGAELGARIAIAADATRLLRANGVHWSEVADLMRDGLAARRQSSTIGGRPLQGFSGEQFPLPDWRRLADFVGARRYAAHLGPWGQNWSPETSENFEILERPPRGSGRWIVQAGGYPLCHPDDRLIVFDSAEAAQQAVEQAFKHRKQAKNNWSEPNA